VSFRPQPGRLQPARPSRCLPRREPDSDRARSHRGGAGGLLVPVRPPPRRRVPGHAWRGADTSPDPLPRTMIVNSFGQI